MMTKIAKGKEGNWPHKHLTAFQLDHSVDYSSYTIIGSSLFFKKKKKLRMA